MFLKYRFYKNNQYCWSLLRKKSWLQNGHRCVMVYVVCVVFRITSSQNKEWTRRWLLKVTEVRGSWEMTCVVFTFSLWLFHVPLIEPSLKSGLFQSLLWVTEEKQNNRVKEK